MKKTLKTLLNRLEKQKGLVSLESEKIDKIKTEIVEHLGPVFSKDSEIKKALVALENTKNYAFNQWGEIEAWIGFKMPEKFNGFEECLKTWLQEQHFVLWDQKNDNLSRNEGPDEIIINHDGDIFQGSKCIISKKDYFNEETQTHSKTKRNALIEAHMEKTDFFPGVFESDYYDNLTPISTLEKETV